MCGSFPWEGGGRGDFKVRNTITFSFLITYMVDGNVCTKHFMQLMLLLF